MTPGHRRPPVLRWWPRSGCRSTRLAERDSSFFLAEIGDEHEGKRMKVTLFDPGEGSNYLQILNPDGNAVNSAGAPPTGPTRAAAPA
ncbi:MAG: hypothetical protein R2695_04455 [Acidimicrobiales bacterium]